MKQLLFMLSLVLVQSAAPVLAQHSGKLESGELDWHTDLMEAQKLSKASHKPIFAFFTGSDWCGWCHKLQNDVFSKPSFIKYAKEKVILLELDFPRQKPQAPELQQQNQSLQQTFQIQGYPTVVYFMMEEDPATKKFVITPWGKQGYPAGAEPGKEDVKFLNEGNEILKQGKGGK